MSTHSSAWLAWSLCALSLLLCAASIVLYVATRSMQPPSNWGTGGDSAVLIVILPFLTFPLVGALIASKRPKNPVGWICLAVGIYLDDYAHKQLLWGLRSGGEAQLGSLPGCDRFAR